VCVRVVCVRASCVVCVCVCVDIYHLLKQGRSDPVSAPISKKPETEVMCISY
jgi:hypothetical protein